MGLLDELIILVKETIDEVNERNKPKPTATPMPQRNEEEMENLRRTLARRAAEARHVEQQAAEHAATEQHAEQERHRHTQERQRHHQKQVEAVHAAQVTRHVGSVDARRVARLVRQPNTMRELMVLRELIDRPLALRRGRR
jgi:hypothetical protein